MKILNQHFINGELVTGAGTEFQPLYNPTTGEQFGQVLMGTKAETLAAISAASIAFKTFATSMLTERGKILQRVYESLMKRKDELNAAAMQEYGSPATATNGRTVYAAEFFLQMKDEMEKYPFERHENFSTVVMEPLGVIGAITPWNADYSHMALKIAPAIATGNTIVLKPSELSGLQTQIFMECLAAAEIPAGVVNIVNGRGADVGTEFVTNSKIAKISFTGSTNVGRVLWQETSENMARMTLELGGKSPTVILEDSELEDAIPKSLLIAFSNSGQACHAGTRLIVPKLKLDEVEKILVESAAKLKVGAPDLPGVTIGPMVSEKQYNRIQEYIQSGIDDGAKLLFGGLGKPAGLERGYFVKPTIFTGVTSDMKIAREEILGPVLSVLTYATQEEAIEIANDTIYGLSAYVFGKDIGNARRVARQIISGRVLINIVASADTRAPFGGMKQSGVGRVHSHYSLDEYLEPKSILLK